MISVALFGSRIVQKVSFMFLAARKLCDSGFQGCKLDQGFLHIEEPLKRIWKDFEFDNSLEDRSCAGGSFLGRRRFLDNVKVDAIRVIDILLQDNPGFDLQSALDELHLRVSALLVREVFVSILKNVVVCTNKSRCAEFGYKFFLWSGNHKPYRHTSNSYHLMMKLFAECGEYKSMWILVDEMIEIGVPTTARTFIVLICTCCEAGLARNVVERFIKSKTFNCRPFKQSYNAIMLGLLSISHYKLIEWVYQQMLVEGFPRDVLTFNIVMCAKYRLGKSYQFCKLLDEMQSLGISPDFHTYNLIFHILGKGNNPLAALNLLNHMKKVGFDLNVSHFTTLIDGLGRAGNLDACEYFFNEMLKNGCMPDVVCYTVMITGYVVGGELEKAEDMFEEMTIKGHLPNVFTYNAMILGLCRAGKYKEACSMLYTMESRGCSPNFVVYNTLVSNLRSAGKLDEAHKVIKKMKKKGRYAHLVSKIKGSGKYRRCRFVT